MMNDMNPGSPIDVSKIRIERKPPEGEVYDVMGGSGRWEVKVHDHGPVGLRMCDEESGEIGHTQVVDVWQSGVKPVFRVTLEDGYAIKMTKDHRCLTQSGWMTLSQATGVRLRDDGGVTWNGAAPALAVNGT